MNIAVLMWYDNGIKSYADNFYKIIKYIVITMVTN